MTWKLYWTTETIMGVTGVTLATEAQGHGYASEALARLSAHAFSDLAAERLHAGVHPGDGRVIRLFTRAGWRYEGTVVQAYRHRDQWDDEATYTLSRTAFQQRTMKQAEPATTGG